MSFTVPTGWEQLSQGQLRYIIRLFNIYDETVGGMQKIKTAAMFHFMKVRVDSETDAGFLCYKTDTGETFILDMEYFAWMLKSIEWLEHPENMNVRLEYIHGCQACSFMLLDLPFGKYLECDNYFQAWYSKGVDSYLYEIFKRLYHIPEDREKVKLTPFDYKAIILWWSAVNYRYQSMFPHLYNEEGENAQVDRESRRACIDAQIRMLTKGDVTKEDLVLNHTMTIRALTELDAQAKESEEIKRIMNKNK